MKGVQAKLTLKEGATPRFLKPRSVPVALKDAIEQDLERLRVLLRKWIIAGPIVAVTKTWWSIRISGDFKVTKCKIVGGKISCSGYFRYSGTSFPKLEAYQQVLLDPASTLQ